MRFQTFFRCCSILTLCLSFISQADIIRVPRDFDVLQDAVNRARAGDTILVAAGEYQRITLNQKVSLTMIGTDMEAEDKATIFGLPETRVEVAVNMIQCSDIEFTGFELTLGYTAIWLQNCNRIWLHHNYIHDLPDWWSSSVSVSGGTDILIERNIMLRSWHYGVYVNFGVQDIIVRHNIIGWMVNNDAVHLDNMTGADVYNNIIFRNGDYGVFVTENTDNVRVAYNDFFANDHTIGGVDFDRRNILENPRFLDEDNEDFFLRGDSPCIDGGDPDSDPDPDNTRADIGLFFFAHGEGAPIIIIDPEALEGEGDSEHVLNITNEGNSPLWWRFFSDVDWISCDPNRGMLEQFEDMDAFILLEADDMEDGIYDADLHVLSNDPENWDVIVPITMTIGEFFDEQIIDFARGWNLISLNIIPADEFWNGDDGPDIRLMTEQLRIDDELHSVILLKDRLGRFYAPEFDFCEIPFWNLQQAYQVKVRANAVGFWRGNRIAANTEIPLSAGWNFVPYYPTYELDANEPDMYVLGSILENVIIAKDNSGHFLSPALEFSNMPPWQAGQGYLVNMLQQDVLLYPEEVEGEFEAEPRYNPLRHWSKPEISESNMSLLLISYSPEDQLKGLEVAAFNANGTLVGSGCFDGKYCGMALWGDDPYTEFKEGFSDNEIPSFRIWDGTSESPATYNPVMGNYCYKKDELAVGYLEWSSKIVISSFILVETFPNPFNKGISIRFDLSESSWVTIDLTDITGRFISTLKGEYFPSGENILSIDNLEIPSGIGFIKLSTRSDIYLQKVVMQK